ncbi:hypothetical protein CGCF415_v015481 [Colletotrichum fructicola]|uniref:Cupin domain-containing protein n=2 Tax=Colletotrichum gloeosporioides species complex TaxID=2707338 RepID=L2FMN6_COLFN|nr:uncharacterized protein CGMCC3_g9668 [Colletotrichum fructicola]KAF4474169.1 hypothetical protein CGGC5_v016745 [Colletotrichum fructicola Nara gc5]KAE9574302.1 hypothetical protein CGMCC3_g9668 [Colletotrichum fructicola]KAF4431709.1 hypothetical protein CFRS1_v011288 [Colletotrichum fructicola]KAF4884803.1 hypothetical protein CGCFRS4_v012393 [Colletotrichum fructicola]KAF4885076.1 hypothetical protein CGCF415_v015481 [Colletotrichum fructicola]
MGFWPYIGTMENKAQTPFRRIVTHHKNEKSSILINEELQFEDGWGSQAVTIWKNQEYPAEYQGEKPDAVPIIYTHGSLIRAVEFPPHSQGHNHRTASLDYGIVMEGELELLLEDGSRTSLRAGDIVVQQATMHQWNNVSDKPARIIFVLLPGQKTTKDGVDVTEKGVPAELLPKRG